MNILRYLRNLKMEICKIYVCAREIISYHCYRIIEKFCCRSHFLRRNVYKIFSSSSSSLILVKYDGANYRKGYEMETQLTVARAEKWIGIKSINKCSCYCIRQISYIFFNFHFLQLAVTSAKTLYISFCASLSEGMYSLAARKHFWQLRCKARGILSL